MRVAQFVPIGIPTVCLQTLFPNLTKVLSNKKLRALQTSSQVQCVYLDTFLSVKKALSLLQARNSLFSLANVFRISAESFSLIRLCGKEVYNVEKSYVLREETESKVESLFRTSPEFFMDQNKLMPEFSYTLSQYLFTCDLISVRHDVNSLETLVVVHRLELAMNLALYGVLWS